MFQMRSTKGVSMWPVALVGGLRYEGPICAEGHVKEFFTAWMPQRQFPVDMAAFAINLRVLFEHPTAAINPDVARGFLETDFLQQLDVKMEQIEAKGNDCKKVSTLLGSSWLNRIFVFVEVGRLLDHDTITV